MSLETFFKIVEGISLYGIIWICGTEWNVSSLSYVWWLKKKTSLKFVD